MSIANPFGIHHSISNLPYQRELEFRWDNERRQLVITMIQEQDGAPGAMTSISLTAADVSSLQAFIEDNVPND